MDGRLPETGAHLLIFSSLLKLLCIVFLSYPFVLYISCLQSVILFFLSVFYSLFVFPVCFPVFLCVLALIAMGLAA